MVPVPVAALGHNARVHVTIPKGLHVDWQPVAHEAVLFGLRHGAGEFAACAEVHAKAARPRRRWGVVGGRRNLWFARKRDAVSWADRYGGDIEVRDIITQRWTSGRAYDGVPSIAKVESGTRYLVTLKLPVRSDGTPIGRFPRTWQYDRYVTAPAVTFDDWAEEVVHSAAHEGRHVWQFGTDAPRSEIDAETHACTVLEQWRAENDGLQLQLF